MRIGFLSDIHGNREALDACLAQVRRQGVDRLVILGDLVGYGADPAWVVDCVRSHVERGALAVMGNHDAAVTRGPRPTMRAEARASIDWTRTRLDASQLDFLAQLAADQEVVMVDNRGQGFTQVCPGQR